MFTSEYKKISLTKLITTFPVTFLLISILSGIAYFASSTSALSIDNVSGSDITPLSVSVDNSPLAYYISVSSSHGSSSTPVTLEYTMDGSGNQLGNVVSSSDVVSIDTNSPMPHQLLLSTTSASNKLLSIESNEEVVNTYIAPTSSTSLSTASSLSSNSWGFALSNNTPGIVANNFNTEAEYTSTNQSILNSTRYTAVPVKDHEVLLTEDTSSTSTTTIYYGVLADRSIPAGSYSNTILYTALAEQPSEIRVSSTNANTGAITTSPAIIEISDTTSLHSAVTIYTSINTTSDNLGTATVTFKDNSNSAAGTVEDALCTNSVVNRDNDNFIYVTCVSPAMPAGTYSVELTLPEFGRILAQTNAIEYSGTPLIQSITNMQQMTTDICKTMPIGQTKSLKDTRGSYNTTTPANYGIIKAKDNNCWMTDNLNLYNRTVTSSDTDIPSGSFTIPDTSNWTGNTYTSTKVHRATNVGYADQVYYNWCSAVTLTTTCDTIERQNQSICPKNWQLPPLASSIRSLFAAYNIAAGYGIQIVNTETGNILGFTKYYGKWAWWSGGLEEYQGVNIELWSSEPIPDRANFAFGYLIRNNNGTISFYNNTYHFEKDSGLSIRCVAR